MGVRAAGWGGVGQVRDPTWAASNAPGCVFSSSGVPCTENDYKLWSPSDERGNECLLGHKTVFKRRTPHATCFNGEDFDRPVVVSNCSCTREDYEWSVLHRGQGLSSVLVAWLCGKQTRV